MDRKRAMCLRGGLAAVLLLLWIAVSITPARGEANKPEHDSAVSVAHLLKELELPESSANVQRRRDAARQLSEINPLPTEAIAPLAKALDTWDRGGVQRYASAALAGAGARAIPALAAECSQSRGDGEGCQAAIGSLSTIAKTDPAAWPVLIDDLKSAFGAGAAIGLGKVGAPVVPLLRQALKDEHPKTRAMAAKALSDIGPPAKDAIPDLLPLLNDTAGQAQADSGAWPSPVVQYGAALALATIDPTRKEALPVLSEALTNDWMTGADAIKAVQKMGSNGRDAIPALARVLASGVNRSDAVHALATIEGRSAGPVLARVLKNDKDSNVRFHAARALADLGPDCPETIPALVEALGDNQVDTASELARLGKPGVLALMPALKSGDLDVRKRVVNALSDLALTMPWVAEGGEQTRALPDYLVDALMRAMSDKSITIREQAARSLQAAGGEPERLALGELDREDKIYAQQSRLNAEPCTREQIGATIPPDEDNKYPLTLEYLFPIYRSVVVEEPAYLLSLHRGRERGDRLVFWKRVDENKYRGVKIMESDAFVLTDGRFLTPKVFRASVQVIGEGNKFNEGQAFVDVPQNGCNTWCVIDNVFTIRGDEVVPVEIESPEKWYEPKLKRGESTWHSNSNTFVDDRLSFAFSIWAGEDPHASPSAGEVTGTYKIIRETTYPAAAAGGLAYPCPASPGCAPVALASSSSAKPVTTWKMEVDTAERKPSACR